MAIREHCKTNSVDNRVPSEIVHLVSDVFRWYEVVSYDSSMDSVDFRFFEKVNDHWVEVQAYAGCGGEKGIVIKRLPFSGGGVVVGGVKRWAQMYINANAQTLANGMGASLQPKEDGTLRTFEDDGKELFDYDSQSEKVGSEIVKASAAMAGSIAAAMAITSRGKSFITNPDSLKTIRKGFTGKLGGSDVKIPDMPIKRIDYKKRNRTEYDVLFKDSRKAKADFNKSLVDSPDKIANLKKQGLTDKDVAKLQKKRPPDGHQVHHKLPLDDGGTNDPSNLVLIKNHPYHKVITNYQNDFARNMVEGSSKVVEFPVPKGNFYSPK